VEKEKGAPHIAIFTGTKAQLIKMAPIALELERHNVDYRLIDTGQHGALIEDIVGKYGVR
jgi:UDP-N-acetylglucosamine 2-epimerase (non-hydrolysing)